MTAQTTAGWRDARHIWWVHAVAATAPFAAVAVVLGSWPWVALCVVFAVLAGLMLVKAAIEQWRFRGALAAGLVSALLLYPVAFFFGGFIVNNPGGGSAVEHMLYPVWYLAALLVLAWPLRAED